MGPGGAAVEVELPAALKSELPVAGALGGGPEGALESELAGALGSASVPVGALESKLAGSCIFPWLRVPCCLPPVHGRPFLLEVCVRRCAESSPEPDESPSRP